MTITEYIEFLNNKIVEIVVTPTEISSLVNVAETFNEIGLDSLDVTMLLGEIGDEFILPTSSEHEGFIPNITGTFMSVQDTIDWINTYGSKGVN